MNDLFGHPTSPTPVQRLRRHFGRRVVRHVKNGNVYLDKGGWRPIPPIFSEDELAEIDGYFEKLTK